MKTVILPLISLFLAPPIQGAPEPSTKASMEALWQSKIPALDLDEQSFDSSFAEIEAEWRKQHPDLSFPVIRADYRNESGHPAGPYITMHLKDVPFIEALRYLRKSSGHRLVERPEILSLEEVVILGPHGYTELHPFGAEMAKKLGVGEKPTPEDLATAYARYGVKLEEWMRISLSGDKLALMANERQHQQIAGINLLLEQGFTISKKE